MFLKRLLKDGMKDHPFWYAQAYNPMWSKALNLPNCTCYVWGRLAEIAGKTMRETGLVMTDAKTYYPNSKWQKGTTPKIGAVACWNGSAGHVAIVERIFEDGSVLVSESHYDSNKSYTNPKFFDTRKIKPAVGKVTEGIGLVFQGYLYNPFIKDLRVPRDETKDQVEVLASEIRARKTPGGAIHSGLFCLEGIYNVLAFEEKDGYIWAQLDADVWIATNDKDKWTKTHKKENEDQEIEELKRTVSSLTAQLVEANKRADALEVENTQLEKKINQIKTILG